MHSHHSHSGEYVAHGVDPLDSMIAQAEAMGFETFCLTEHMPRIDTNFLYPEELESSEGDGAVALEKLQENFSLFLKHAQSIKKAHPSGHPNIIIGTEVEGCDSHHIQYAKQLLKEHNDTLRFCVGSVHHINGIAIDYDQACWDEALLSFGNNFKEMLLSYFNLQYELLTVLQPMVVGHFDLFKLLLPANMTVNPLTGVVGKSDDTNSVPVTDLTYLDLWPEVKALVVRNLQYINSYGGAVEINTSALRKGLAEPYPSRNIAELVKLHNNGRFVLSDDSHGIKQVGTCYGAALKYITETLHLKEMYYLHEETSGTATNLTLQSMPIDQFVSSDFWKQFP